MNSADSCMAAAAVARSHAYADKARQRTYREALERYARVLVEGYQKDASRKGWEGSKGWVITRGDDQGAIGMGVLNGQVAVRPSTASTAAGSLFFAQLYTLTEKPEYRRLAADGVRWLIQEPEAQWADSVHPGRKGFPESLPGRHPLLGRGFSSRLLPVERSGSDRLDAGGAGPYHPLAAAHPKRAGIVGAKQPKRGSPPVSPPCWPGST